MGDEAIIDEKWREKKEKLKDVVKYKYVGAWVDRRKWEWHSSLNW